MVEVLDGLQIERAHLIGFHTGNKIAAAMAAHYPDRVAKTVLIGMTHSLVVSRRARNVAIMEIVRRHFGGFEPTPDGSHLLRTWGSDFGALAGRDSGGIARRELRACRLLAWPAFRHDHALRGSIGRLLRHDPCLWTGASIRWGVGA